MNNSDSVWYVVLGAILALATSFVLEIIKIGLKTRNESRDFKITLKFELKGLISSIDRLIDDYGKKQYFPFVIINELNAKLQKVDKIRDNIILIKDDFKKEQILAVLNDIYIFYSDTQSLETAAFGSPNLTEQGEKVAWNQEIFKSQRQMLAIKSVDLKRKVQDLVIYLENR